MRHFLDYVKNPSFSLNERSKHKQTNKKCLLEEQSTTKQAHISFIHQGQTKMCYLVSTTSGKCTMCVCAIEIKEMKRCHHASVDIHQPLATLPLVWTTRSMSFLVQSGNRAALHRQLLDSMYEDTIKNSIFS